MKKEEKKKDSADKEKKGQRQHCQTEHYQNIR